MTNPESKVIETRKTVLRDIVITLVLLIFITLIVYQVASSISSLLFVNKISDKEVVAFRYTNRNIPFACGDIIDDISGQRMFSLNVSLENQAYYLYSENLSSSNIRDVSVITLNGKEFPVLWPSEVDNGTERIINGRFTNFYKLGTKESVSVLVVENFREPDLLDLVVSTNRLLLCQIAVILTALTAIVFLSSLGVMIALWAALPERKKTEKK
jgi:hypothetical protein